LGFLLAAPMVEKNIVLVLAAGRGVRMGREKAFIPLGGRPLLAWTLLAFEPLSGIHEIIAVVAPEERRRCLEEVIVPHGIAKARVVAGGKERQDSLENGFDAIGGPCCLVAVHDGARPFVEAATVEAVLKAAHQDGAAVVAVPAKDTIKVGDEYGWVKETLDRRGLWVTQTPQAYRYEVLRQALEEARMSRRVATDDSALVEALGKPVRIVPGSYENIKITTPEDLFCGELILRERIKRGQGA
jgi:2-C-methyl-D-erythritol 4-phosphate cytidylyltransferase